MNPKMDECRLITAPEIEFATLADEPLSAKYRLSPVKAPAGTDGWFSACGRSGDVGSTNLRLSCRSLHRWPGSPVGGNLRDGFQSFPAHLPQKPVEFELKSY